MATPQGTFPKPPCFAAHRAAAHDLDWQSLRAVNADAPAACDRMFPPTAHRTARHESPASECFVARQTPSTFPARLPAAQESSEERRRCEDQRRAVANRLHARHTTSERIAATDPP